MFKLKICNQEFLKKIYFLNLSVSSNTSFHTSCLLNRSKQIGNAMKKVLGGNVKKKNFYKETIANTSNVFGEVSVKNTSANPRRSIVLHKLFMRNITDLMATGEYSSQILGLGVEVTRIKITVDYKILNVYWTTNSPNVDEVEGILQKCAGLLRHELSTLRLMGHVPVIQFVKDKNSAQLIEINRRLSIADYGEEGPSSTDPAAYLISEFELSVPIEKNIKEKIMKLEKTHPCETNQLNVIELPAIVNNVFDLDHDTIMKRIKKAYIKTKFNDKTVDDNWANFKMNQYSNSNNLNLGDTKSQREAFNKFLQQRQLLKKKKNRVNYCYIEEQEEMNDVHFPDYIEEDFIEDFEKNED